MNFIATILILTVIGIIALTLSLYLNRKVIRKHEIARTALQHNASLLIDGDTEQFVNDLGVNHKEIPAAYKLLDFLANLLQVKPAKLAGNYQMSELFEYTNSSLAESIEPFAYDLYQGIVNLTNQSLWNTYMKINDLTSENEEDVIDFFMDMTVKEFINFFAPMMSQPS